MTGSRRRLKVFAGRTQGIGRLIPGIGLSMLCLSLMVLPKFTVFAGSGYLDTLSGGVSSILDPGANNTTDAIHETAEKIDSTEEEEDQHFNKVMADVKSALNIRSEANEDSQTVGKLYKDCGGTILERKDGWTKIQSGNVVGWAKDEYLLFDGDAIELAREVGKTVAYMDDVLRVRREPSRDAEVCGVLPKGEVVDVIAPEEGQGTSEETGLEASIPMDTNDSAGAMDSLKALMAIEGDTEGESWICIEFDDEEGYVSAEHVTLDFIIDAGETVEEIKIREEAEAAAKREAERHKNYGAYTTDADTTLLLAALIQCEAGGESYEGKVAVGAVVMNRVRSSAYPDTIHGVIYASGQFTPAMSGKLNRVYESGKISEECIKAAQDALSGTSPVGDLTHFRRNDGRNGLVLGHHVFY